MKCTHRASMLASLAGGAILATAVTAWAQVAAETEAGAQVTGQTPATEANAENQPKATGKARPQAEAKSSADRPTSPQASDAANRDRRAADNPADRNQADRNQADRNQADRNQADRNQADRNQADRNQADRNQADRDQPARSRDAAERERPQDATERDARRGQERARGGEESGDESAQTGLGLEFDQQAERGLTISNVQQNSIAADAGLRAGDRIVSVDGRRIGSQRQLLAYLSGQPGRRVPLVVERDGQMYSVQLRSMPASGETAWLGVYLQDSDEQQRGAVVTSVYPTSPAARAGLRAGDVIVAVNDQQIASTPDLVTTIEQMQPQSEAQLTVLRGGQERTVPVVLGRRDSYVTYYRNDEDRVQERYAEGQTGRDGQRYDEDDYESFPPHLMQLEHDRRNAEQHQRIESEIRKLQEEVRKLRELIEQKNN